MTKEEAISNINDAISFLQGNKATVTPDLFQKIKVLVPKISAFVELLGEQVGLTADQITKVHAILDKLVAAEDKLINSDATDKALKFLNGVKSHPLILSLAVHLF